MNKKGFTLVELLAVIVILAIVALVTTPAILNVINNSRLEGAKDKAWGVINSVKSAYAQAQMSGYEDSTGNGVSVSGENLMVTFSNGAEAFGSKKITMTGERPTSGTVTINKTTGTITCTDLYFKENGTFYCTSSDGKSMKCDKESSASKGMRTSDLKELVVTKGDGLYADSTEAGRYVYRGANPNNYITLGSDMYRIIAVENDGTLKVIRNGSIGDIAFDTAGARYSTTDIDYCNYSESGCKVWGSKTTMLDSSGNNVSQMPREVGGSSYNLPEAESTLNTYLNNTWLNTLSTDVQNKITSHTFNVGVVYPDDTAQTLATDVSQEQAYKWKGKVGLMNPSDYVKASTNSACTSIYSYWHTSSCYDNGAMYNWMYVGPASSSYSWTISSYSTSDAGGVFFVYMDGDLNYYDAYSSRGVAPVLFLSSNIKLKGEGTTNTPYEIS